MVQISILYVESRKSKNTFILYYPILFIIEIEEDRNRELLLEQLSVEDRLITDTFAVQIYGWIKDSCQLFLVSLTITSCAPPSMMLVDDTRVILASFFRSAIDVTPQLHMVDLILPRLISRLSLNLPA
jgi:hypothetical protein